ncbi:MAG: aminotransferase class IV, partial [Rhodospirillales bacterium]|nr:aminotransferase class IV [Rhodospirillales bacterium]
FDIERARKGVDVITLHDIRWKRRDIKSISLLPNVLGKQEAREKGAYEAWLVDDDGTVTEGTSSNAWIVSSEGELITRQADEDILSGITRLAIMRLAQEEGIILVQRPFTVAEAKSASEAFVTSSTSFIKPVIRIDGERIGTGDTGPVADKLLTYYGDYLDSQEPMK